MRTSKPTHFHLATFLWFIVKPKSNLYNFDFVSNRKVNIERLACHGGKPVKS